MPSIITVCTALFFSAFSVSSFFLALKSFHASVDEPGSAHENIRTASLAPLTLLIVLLSIMSILIGIVKTAVSPIDLPICIIEKNHVQHLIKSSILKNNVARYCHANETCADGPCPLRHALCTKNISTTIVCSDLDHVHVVNGIPGLSKSPLSSNLKAMHMREGEIRQGVQGEFSLSSPPSIISWRWYLAI